MDKEKIISLAEKYETAEFLALDPSQFMHRYQDKIQQELVAFLAANLAFGQRKQILSHVETVLLHMKDSPSEWILSGKYDSFFNMGKKSFYRMYTHDAMKSFFETQKNILKEYGSLGECFRLQWEKENSSNKRNLAQIISENFEKECNLIPHTKDSASKKLNMFLRWMVRSDSPVDLGLWTWFDKKDLLMPLDVHVMEEATRLGFLEPNSKGNVRSANLKTCIELTEKMKEIFPEDPLKADFALFGLGVDSDKD